MRKFWENDFVKGDEFIVTGVLTNGKRFKAIHSDNIYHALGINLWKGSVWLVRDSKRICVKKVGW